MKKTKQTPFIETPRLTKLRIKRAKTVKMYVDAIRKKHILKKIVIASQLELLDFLISDEQSIINYKLNLNYDC